MSVVTKTPSANRVILNGVSWEAYERLLQDFEDRSSPRFAYDHGVLEIMTLYLEHEQYKWTISSIVEMCLEEMDSDYVNAGHTTFKREAVLRGFEADASFYIRNVDRIRHKKRIDLELDPPPDLAIEIDLTRDSLDKLSIYAALRIPEVWRYKDSLEMMTLDKNRYVRVPASTAIPVLTPELVMELVRAYPSMKRPTWARQTRARIRKLI